MHPVYIRDGAFELRGLDPERPYPLLFVDHPRPLTHMMSIELLKSFGQLLLGPDN
jgi:hypothetical protein